MFTAEQMSEFQTKLHESFQNAQQRASTRARELEADARKILETLGDRVQAELEELRSRAQVSSKDQLSQLGAELIKLGKKLQSLASDPKSGPKADVAPRAADASGSGVQPPADLQ